MDKVKAMGGFCVTPVRTSLTTRMIPKGHAGAADLPVTDISDDIEMSAWVIPRDALEAWLVAPYVLQLLRAADGSVSITVMPRGLAQEH